MRALKRGSPAADIEETLRIVGYMSTMACLAHNAGPEAVARMKKPLSAAVRRLRAAAAGSI